MRSTASKVTIVGWDALSEYISGLKENVLALKSLKAAFNEVGFYDFTEENRLAQSIKNLN